MSRLIVKNLPNNITVDKLREIFLQKGEITDVQLKYTREGKFRNFGFVGFRTEEQAIAAQNHFNGTCIRTNRIVVESCVSLGSTSKPKAWSKYTPDSSAYKKSHNITGNIKKDAIKLIEKKLSKEERKLLKKEQRSDKIREILQRHKDDPLFTEFMEVHASKINKAVWSNDGVLKANKNDDDAHSSPNEPEEETAEDDDDKKLHVSDEETLKEQEEKKKNDEKLALQTISDLEYMKSLMKKTEKTSETVDVDEEDGDKIDAKTEVKKKIKTPKNRILFMVKIQGLPFACKKKDIKDFFRPLVPFTIRIPRCQTKFMRGFCYVGFRTEEERKKALFKSRSFLGGNRVTVDKYDKKNVQDLEENQKSSKTKHKEQEESLKNEETIAESGKIYVRNLPYITTEDELQELFQKFGPVTEVNMPVDNITHKPKGFALVTFMMPEHAVNAYTELDGSVFCGRMLHLLPGKQKEEQNPDEENLTFKQKQDLKKKAQSGSAHNWNTLFLGANAVADVFSDTYNTAKEKLLDSNTKSSAAVKLALAETHLVATTRTFLEESGICLDAFNQAPKKRSKTVILVKNLPAKTTSDEIKQLFEPFGLIARFVIPPNGVTAIVEFVEPSEARKAFSKLAYSKFKHLPLYLEMAPDNVFIKPADRIENPQPEESTSAEKQIKNVEKKQMETETTVETKNIQQETTEDDEIPEPDTILFVKGLNFETREDRLRQHFETCGRIHSVTIAMKKDPHNPGQKLSMGYGFVEFYRKNSAEKALKSLQLSSLDDKQIELKRSERTGRGDVKTAKKETKIGKQTGTKILVRNVPFQANRNEITEIFSAFGEIKALRLPKKMQPGEDRHRGFCFVEYHNKSDAKNAFGALCQSTHLYGRRLVLEWAKSEDDVDMVDEIRKRTAESYNMSMPGGKKSKKAVVELEDMDEEDDN